jgi:tetratricopeptide (TPR) repeat protein
VALAAAGGATGWWNWPRTRGPLPSQVPEANQLLEMAREAGPGQRAKELVLQALEKDPRFAYARALYAWSLIMDIDQGHSNNRDDLLNRADIELRRALEDDPYSAEAYSSLALVYYYRGRKHLMQEAAERSLDLDPANRDAKVHLAIYHQLNGDYGESQAILRDVIESASSDSTDAVVLAARGNYAENLREMGDFPGAIHEYDRIFNREPRFLLSRVLLAQAYQTDGQYAASRRLLTETTPSDRTNYVFRLVWALQLALDGRRDEARGEMEDPDLQRYVETVFFALYAAEVYALLGDATTALRWLNRGFEAGDERVEWLEHDPHLRSIHDHPGFRQLAQTIRARRAPHVNRWFRWFAPATIFVGRYRH